MYVLDVDADVVHDRIYASQGGQTEQTGQTECSNVSGTIRVCVCV